MPKGHHTSGAVVLFERMPSPQEVNRALAPLEVVKQLEGSEAKSDWMAGRFGVVVAMRREVNGTLVVQGFDNAWPDGMGSPKEDPMLFGAWAMGFFGPFTFPGNLERATQHAYAWNGAADAVRRHRGFVRLLTTYVGGANPDAPCLPPDYEPLAELHFLTRAAQLVGGLPGALAYFDSSGEVLKPVPVLRESLDWHSARGLPPLDLWANVRLFRTGIASWTLMDTVGMSQLDVDDHEVCFPADRFAPEQLANFLRNSTDYVRKRGPVIQHGDTMDGPGGIRWRAFHAEEALTAPPRRSLRWLPEGFEPPAELLSGIAEDSGCGS